MKAIITSIMRAAALALGLGPPKRSFRDFTLAFAKFRAESRVAIRIINPCESLGICPFSPVFHFLEKANIVDNQPAKEPTRRYWCSDSEHFMFSDDTFA